MTERQWGIVQFIEFYWIENWTSPTVDEIREELGLVSKATVACHLENLVRLGVLERKRLSRMRVLYRAR